MTTYLALLLVALALATQGEAVQRCFAQLVAHPQKAFADARTAVAAWRNGLRDRRSKHATDIELPANGGAAVAVSSMIATLVFVGLLLADWQQVTLSLAPLLHEDAPPLFHASAAVLTGGTIIVPMVLATWAAVSLAPDAHGLWFGKLTSRARLAWRVAAWTAAVLAFIAGIALAVQRSEAIVAERDEVSSAQPVAADAVVDAALADDPGSASATAEAPPPAQAIVTYIVMIASTIALLLCTAIAFEAGPAALIRLLPHAHMSILILLGTLTFLLATAAERVCGAIYGGLAAMLDVGRRMGISVVRPAVTAGRAVHARETARGNDASITKLAITAPADDVQVPDIGVRDTNLLETTASDPKNDTAPFAAPGQPAVQPAIGDAPGAMWSPPFNTSDTADATHDARSA